jgi:hypothetical protein
MPCALTPEQILEVAPKGSRSVLLAPNVIAYFGDLLIDLNAAIRRLSVAPSPVNTGHIGQSYTASAPDPS